MGEGIKRIVVDGPGSVKDQLEALASEMKTTVKDLILKAIEQTYGIRPKGE